MVFTVDLDKCSFWWSGRNESLFRVSTREEYEKASMEKSFEDTLLEGRAEKWGNY